MPLFGALVICLGDVATLHSLGVCYVEPHMNSRIVCVALLLSVSASAAPPVPKPAPGGVGGKAGIDESIRPVTPKKVGGSDDSIRPVSPNGTSGTDDDSLRPVKPGTKSGTSDDGVRPVTPTQVDPKALRTAAFDKEVGTLKEVNAELNRNAAAALRKNPLNVDAFRKQVEACVNETKPEARTACNAALAAYAKANFRPALKRSGIDHAKEAKKLAGTIGMRKVPRPNAPEEPEVPPEDMGLVLVTEASATLAPLAKSKVEIKTAPFAQLDGEGEGQWFTGGDSISLHCGAVWFGACYKRIGQGSRFNLLPTMVRGQAQAKFRVSADAMAVAALGYGSSEAKIHLRVRRLTGTNIGEVCRSEERSLVHAVAPFLSIGNASLGDTEGTLSCNFKHEATSGVYEAVIVLEIWAGSGGAVGAGASASGIVKLNQIEIRSTRVPE